MKKLLILPLALFLLVQSGLAQTPKWVEKAKRAVFSVITYDKNDKMLNTGNGFFQYAAGALYAVFFPHAPVCNSYLAITFPVNVFC